MFTMRYGVIYLHVLHPRAQKWPVKQGKVAEPFRII